MRKITTLIFTILFSLTGYSQQFPLQSQYQYNYSVINPAVVVENDYTSIRASFRQQWVGFSDNPIATQLFTINRGFGKNGLGATIFNDETGGAFSKSGLSLSYAHKVKFSTSELYLGVSGGAAKVNLSNIGDPSVINSEDIKPIFILGMPRSGTTLVEQIISSHPEVYGAGELNAIGRLCVPLVLNKSSSSSNKLSDEAKFIRSNYLSIDSR